jgi:7-cyano-7-deazaguanine synthase in queuosine biosynthesis
MSNLVLWSGGADSTYLLDRWARVSSEHYPVRAVTVIEHPKLSKPFLKAQRAAQLEYLAHARKKGYHIKHEIVRVQGSFAWGVEGNSGDHGRPTAQSLMWLHAIGQVIGDEDKVIVGYIRGDAFWHFRDEFEATFKAMCKLKGVQAELRYDLEWQYKADILRLLKKAKIPQRCWFSCESTTDGKPCGACSKCDEIAYAKQHWRYKADTREVEAKK